jgi:formate dehydrogenase subunit gamma
MEEEPLERYSFGERVVHGAAALCFVYLLVTGLALFVPLLYWLATLVGGGVVARAWHPWVGLAYVATLAAMYGFWRRDMRLTSLDRDWSRALVSYIRNEDARVPPAGRFNAGQKQFFWAMIASGGLLLVSGLVLWVPHWIGPRWRLVNEVAIVVHVVAALASIGLFIVHVYMGTAVVRGSFTAIVSGRVSPAWARAHHLAWYREARGERPPSAERG